MDAVGRLWRGSGCHPVDRVGSGSPQSVRCAYRPELLNTTWFRVCPFVGVVLRIPWRWRVRRYRLP